MAMPSVDVELDDEFIISLSQNRCVNRVNIVGRLVTRPKQVVLSSKTQMTTFNLITAEWFGAHRLKHRLNFHEIQVLGKDSERSLAFKPGEWVVVDGYLRMVNERGDARSAVRTYAIRAWQENDNATVETQTAPTRGRSRVPRSGSS